MKHIVSAALFIVGVIHLLPLAGVLGSEKLKSLYGVPVDDRNLEILLRHRAVLFGMLGAYLIVAAFKPAQQSTALAAGFISVISFLALAVLVGNYNELIRRVVLADVVALVLLVIASATVFLKDRP